MLDTRGERADEGIVERLEEPVDFHEDAGATLSPSLGLDFANGRSFA
jgi:hypothetical protein